MLRAFIPGMKARNYGPFACVHVLREASQLGRAGRLTQARGWLSRCPVALRYLSTSAYRRCRRHMMAPSTKSVAMTAHELAPRTTPGLSGRTDSA